MSKNNYNIKKLARLNNIDQKYDTNLLKEEIIKPIKIEKPKENIVKIFNNEENEYNKKIQEYWKNRVNLPYKGIIKDFDYNKKINDEQDLVVHKVTKDDKKDFEKNVKKYETKIKEHNKELDEKYAKTKIKEHKKDFEKEHKYKYISKSSGDTTTTDDLRTDRIEFYKKEQEKTEHSKKQLDDILNELVNLGVIDNNMNNINYDNINVDKLQSKLIGMLGEEEYNKLLSS